jgi:hypothetical protein
LDGEHVDAVLLAAAKDHCTACPDCAAWVRALVRVRAAEAPTPPADLPDRIMARVRAIEAEKHPAPAPAQAQAAPEPEEIPADIAAMLSGTTRTRPAPQGEALGFERLIHKLLDPDRRLPNLLWAATAVTGVVGIAVVLTVTMRMSSLRSGQTPENALVLDTYGTAPQATPEPEGLAKVPEPGEMGALDTQAAASSTLIVVNDIVYRAGGVDLTTQRASLSVIGNTTTSLDVSGEPRERTVLGSSDLSRVYIEADDGSLLAFVRVTRTYQGKTYALNSGNITGYGQAPSLPARFSAPTSPDGSPTFQADAADPNVFVLIGQSADQGIALPPGADSISSNWTWWTPVP